MSNDDLTLLQAYARQQSEAAFAELVSRYLNLVYSAVLRQVGEPHLAEDVTQAVFIVLARKASSLSPKTILPGWLVRTAGYTSANALKLQRRRQQREQEAYMQSTSNPSEAASWQHIAPLLDEALGQLDPSDHDALVLRYFEGKEFKAVGAALGASEDAAKKRVSRALEKLRKFFRRRGVSSSTAIIAGAIAAHSVQAAPGGLAQAIAALAAAQGAAANASTLALVKGALKTMAWMKVQTAAAAAVCVVLAAGALTTGVYQGQQIFSLRRQARALQQEQPQWQALEQQAQALQRERDRATNALAVLAAENAALKGRPVEGPELRRQTHRLQQEKV